MSTPSSAAESSTADAPRISAVIVHWRNEEEVVRLVEAWPADPRFECLVIDNSRTLDRVPPPGRLLTPAENLGFAGGVNHGVRHSRAPIVLLLNPDIRPCEGALEALLAAIDRYPAAAGWTPALFEPDGTSQHRWQLRPLPSPWALLLQTCFLAGVEGPRVPPEAGAVIEQPAGAAWAIKRDIFERLGGLDEGYFPAWFEDVDLARRLANDGEIVRYAPESRWIHDGGGSVPRLGYGRFLWIYYRNLTRYLRLHYGRLWTRMARLTLIFGMTARLLFLPLRCPQRAVDRRHAAAGLLAVIAGTITGWQRPVAYAQLVRRPETEER